MKVVASARYGSSSAPGVIPKIAFYWAPRFHVAPNAASDIIAN
jgi:hypothetical protein